MTAKHFPARSGSGYPLQQIFYLGLASVMLVMAIALVVIAIVLAAPLFGVMALVLGLLTAPILMQLSVSPPLSVDEHGIELQPLLWRKRHVVWHEIEAIQPYGLLPRQDQEVLKRVLQGRNNYEDARGVMLLVPTLPWPYRIIGFFVGRAGQALFAVTNRSHRNYDDFLDQVALHAPHLLKQKVDATHT